MSSPTSAVVPRPSRLPAQRRNRVRKIGIWTDDQLKVAIVAVDEGQSMEKAARDNNIPYSSLRDWCSGKTKSRSHGAKGMLTAAKESELVTYLTKMCDRGYGLLPNALKMKVYEITKT